MNVTDKIRLSVDVFKRASGQKPVRVEVSAELEPRLRQDASLDPQALFDTPTKQWFVDGIPLDIVDGLDTDVRSVPPTREPV